MMREIMKLAIAMQKLIANTSNAGANDTVSTGILGAVSATPATTRAVMPPASRAIENRDRCSIFYNHAVGYCQIPS